MKAATYKVDVPYGYRKLEPHDGTFGSILRQTNIRTTNEFSGIATRLKAENWLHDNNRANHLLNSYDNQERGWRFVFSDKDTALMLKLALT